jgi:hypothetical protein
MIALPAFSPKSGKSLRSSVYAPKSSTSFPRLQSLNYSFFNRKTGMIVRYCNAHFFSIYFFNEFSAACNTASAVIPNCFVERVGWSGCSKTSHPVDFPGSQSIFPNPW